MPAEIIYPDLNPIKMVLINPVQLPQYLTRHLEDYRFHEQQHPDEGEEFKWYDQPWQSSDIIPFQFESNFDPIQIDLVDCYDVAWNTLNAAQKMENKWEPGKYVYEALMDISAVPEGRYWVKMTFGSEVMISEPMMIKAKHPSTIRYDYKHKRFHGDVIFETGIVFCFRVKGRLGKLIPGSKDTVYEDEPLNPTLLTSRPFRTFPLMHKNIPDWVVDRINLIWTCSDVLVDNKSFAKSGESKMELIEEENYPMRTLIMNVREGINRGSRIIQPTVDTSKRLVVVHNIEGKLFGDITNPGSSNVIPVTGIE